MYNFCFLFQVYFMLLNNKQPIILKPKKPCKVALATKKIIIPSSFNIIDLINAFQFIDIKF